MTEIAFLGIGLMGLPMARNLLKAGHRVTAWNRSAEKARPLLAEGGRVAATPAEAVKGAEVVFTMLTDGKSVGDLLFRQDAAAALSPGALVIDCSSIQPAEARTHAEGLAKVGATQLDAPVSGGPGGAAAATLAIMAGGSAADYARAEPLLKALGRPTHVGGVGCGQLVKLANQLIAGLALGAVAEALLLVDEGGGDAVAARQAMTGGFADSLILQVHGQRMLDRAFLPGGPAEMHLKDLNNVLAEAGVQGLTLPLATAMRDLFASLTQHFGPRVDHSGVLLEIERRNPGHSLGEGPTKLPA